jgi:mannose-6-phosphate isomerase-like protein (cupin superfamily)
VRYSRAVIAGLVTVAVFGLIQRGIAQSQPAAPAGQSQTVVIQKAPADRSVEMPKELLAKYFADMDARKLQTLRMIEGGKYSVNIRRITNAETALVHPKTIDVWVVLEGSGTLTTGGTIQNGKIVGGQTHPLKAGDVEFIPTNVAHGVSGVAGSITFLNIRWDNDWQTQ